jgi:hypothetical protein
MLDVTCRAMCITEGGVAVAMLARTCTFFGKPEGKPAGALSFAAQRAHEMCKELGVCRLPLSMGEGWCWSRMLGWANSAVRVGPQHEHKTITAGLKAAKVKQAEVELGAHGSLLVLVEPGVYKEGIAVGDGQRVSVWACDREDGKDKAVVQAVVWNSMDSNTLSVSGAGTFVGVNGFKMSTSCHEGLGHAIGVNCATATSRCQLSFERCDLAANCHLSVVHSYGVGTRLLVKECCIQGKSQSHGVWIGQKAKATQ